MLDSSDARKTLDLMQPGRLTRDGMLGTDRRSVDEIIAADQATMVRLGLTRETLAARLREITALARTALGDPVRIAPRLDARVDETRGALTCPFRHPGHYPKTVTYLRDIETGESMQWSDLGVHMLEAHGFCQGKGSAYRLEPEKLATALDIR